VTATPTQKVVAKTPTATPTVVKANATQTVVKANATPTVVKANATPTVVKANATQTVVKATATSSPQVAQGASVTTDPTNATVLEITVPTEQTSAHTSSVASLPPQPVPEFSILGLGIPALLAGAIYLLKRKG
jgi:cobalamin biosynthesis Mg chelatase CobN